MDDIGFDSDRFIEMQSAEILDRIAKFDGKLYLELGGKIFDDLHASRVLPGYRSNNKIKVLESLKDQLEVIICISAIDIINNKIRADFGITYDQEVFRLIDKLKGVGLKINSVCVTMFDNQPGATKFGNKLKRRGLKVYYHYIIDNYPNDIDKICSSEGYGKNPYIPTTRPLVVVSAPGPGSCKMATCLSQLYHEHQRGMNSGYAKLETFPVWDLQLKHMVNIAYEAATADLNDRNIIDPFHKEAYNVAAVNYNRDIQAFPVLSNILNKITGKCIYKSPTDMGVNTVGKCIIDHRVCTNASKQEIIRRYLKAKVEYKKGTTSLSTVERIAEIMKENKLSVSQRTVYKVAQVTQKEKNSDIVAIELSNGKIVTGKNQGLITATAGAVLNALKELSGIEHENIVNREAVKNISELKTSLGLGRSLDLKDIFIALSILSEYDESSKRALKEISGLSNSEIHSTSILPQADENFLRKLKANLTCDDVFATEDLFDAN